jgi:glycosyltransferase involved in cell wall biosynthesis
MLGSEPGLRNTRAGAARPAGKERSLQSEGKGQTGKAGAGSPAKTLLFVGPKPPPIGGSPLTVQAMLAEFARYPNLKVRLISTSPAGDVRKKMRGFKFEKVRRTAAIIPQFLVKAPRSDAAVVFANPLFAVTLAPILLFLAKLFRTPFYLKPVGAHIDLYAKSLKKPWQGYLMGSLRACDGILAQSSLLKENLGKMDCRNAYYLPGCRPLAPLTEKRREDPDELRLIFLSHVIRAKGPLVVLEALQEVAKTCAKKVSCDFYGPIHDDVRDDFVSQIKATPNARYCGVAEAGSGTQVIANYDVLVLPTFFETEGHPGVLIEAMHAGVPVITTQIRTINDLVTDGRNGLLIPLKDSHALAEAIKRLALDPDLVKKLGAAHKRKGAEFTAEAVTAQMLEIVFPGVEFERR